MDRWIGIGKMGWSGQMRWNGMDEIELHGVEEMGWDRWVGRKGLSLDRMLGFAGLFPDEPGEPGPWLPTLPSRDLLLLSHCPLGGRGSCRNTAMTGTGAARRGCV